MAALAARRRQLPIVADRNEFILSEIRPRISGKPILASPVNPLARQVAPLCDWPERAGAFLARGPHAFLSAAPGCVCAARTFGPLPSCRAGRRASRSEAAAACTLAERL